MITYIKFHKPIEFKTGSFSEYMEVGGAILSIDFDGHAFIITLLENNRILIPSSSVSFSRVKHVEIKEVSSSKRAPKTETKSKKRV